ncbi:MAG TPA: DUF5662 family protein [Anaerovoracaceae bacterium]|nr:DUF5662 family protein [Anaerovoracaceae bacterium]
MNYFKSRQLKEAFTRNCFSSFTEKVGGDATEFADILYGKYTVEDFAYADDMYYFSMLEYFNKQVVPHKIAVYEAGLELMQKSWFNKYLSRNEDREQFLWNLWIHDMSKFSANEAFGYAMYNRTTGHGKEGFELAWHHHKMNNPHHLEYWFNPNRSGQLERIPMPTLYVMEMFADWIGAGKTYGQTIEDWLPENLHKFKFGPSKSLVMNILEEMGIRTWIHEGNVLKTHP